MHSQIAHAVGKTAMIVDVFSILRKDALEKAR
jgi:hypothetical protein